MTRDTYDQTKNPKNSSGITNLNFYTQIQPSVFMAEVILLAGKETQGYQKDLCYNCTPTLKCSIL
jgi:hypothetical protein